MRHSNYGWCEDWLLIPVLTFCLQRAFDNLKSKKTCIIPTVGALVLSQVPKSSDLRLTVLLRPIVSRIWPVLERHPNISRMPLYQQVAQHVRPVVPLVQLPKLWASPGSPAEVWGWEKAFASPSASPVGW